MSQPVGMTCWPPHFCSWVARNPKPFEPGDTVTVTFPNDGPHAATVRAVVRGHDPITLGRASCAGAGELTVEPFPGQPIPAGASLLVTGTTPPSGVNDTQGNAYQRAEDRMML